MFMSYVSINYLSIVYQDLAGGGETAVGNMSYSAHSKKIPEAETGRIFIFTSTTLRGTVYQDFVKI